VKSGKGGEIMQKPEISHLSEKSKEIFEHHIGKMKTPAREALFLKGLEALDLSDKAANVLEDEGMLITSKRSGMSRANPAISIRKEATAEFLKIWKALNLNDYLPNIWGVK
jgi:hypothetical protein